MKFIDHIDISGYMIRFFRRTDETHTIDVFVAAIKPRNIGVCTVTKSMWYKDEDGKTYKMTLEEMK